MAARRMAMLTHPTSASSACSSGARWSSSRITGSSVRAYPMSGPGYPSRGPTGWRPVATSAGRSSVQGGGTWSGDSHGSRTFLVGGTGTYSGAAMDQCVHDGVGQGLPRRLDDVLAHTDRAPRALAVSGVEQYPGHRARARRSVEDAHLEVDEMHPVQRRIPRRD